MMKRFSDEDDVELILEGMRAKIASGELDITQMSINDIGYAYVDCAKEVLDNLDDGAKIHDIPAALGRNLKEVYSVQDEFWLNHSSSTYGAEQGTMKKLYHYETPDGKKILPDTPEYKNAIRTNTDLKLVEHPGFVEMADYISNTYNTTSVDAARIITRMDAEQGICSNADLANSIIIAYKDNPIEFKQTFGFEIDEVDKLELDIYMYANTVDNTGNGFISQNTDGTISVRERGTTITRNGVTVTMENRNNNFSFGNAKQGEGYKYDVANAYLDSKGADRHIENINVYSSNGLNDMNDVHLDEVAEALNNGHAVRLSVYPSAENGISTWVMDLDTGMSINENHIMSVTGIERYGFVVDNQGHRSHINFSALKPGKINGMEVRIDKFVVN